MLEEVKDYLKENPDKKVALFSDMDGVLARIEVDITEAIPRNEKDYFLNRKPLKTVIAKLEELSSFPNLDFYILSACSFEDQARDKSIWLKKNAPFFEPNNQLFVIKEIVQYTKENKTEIKTKVIDDVIEKQHYDKVVYVEDEYLMLKKAQKKLQDKIICIHISSFID
jgi:hypothetical protein